MKLSIALVLLCLSNNLFANQINVFFNNDTRYSYIDPYRGFKRQGVDFEKILIDSIDGAKRTLDIAIQEINLPNLAKAIVRAHERGVLVRLILEDSYNMTYKEMASNSKLLENEYFLNKVIDQKNFLDTNNNGYITIKESKALDAITILRESGVPLIDDSLGNRALMHHKFLIIDDELVIVSSANFTRSGTHGDFSRKYSIGNANAMIAVYNESLAQKFLAEINLMWDGVFKNDKNRVLYRPIAKTKLSAQSSISTKFSPSLINEHGWNNSGNGIISREILSARKSFHSALFVFSSQEIANSLLAVRTRNPRFPIEMLVDFGFAVRSWSETLDMWGVQMKSDYCRIEKNNRPWRVAEKGVGVPRMPKGDKLHHKFAVIDGKKVIFGSHNWSGSANIKNDETLLVIEDAYVAQEFIREYYRLAQNASFGVPRYVTDKIAAEPQTCP